MYSFSVLEKRCQQAVAKVTGEIFNGGACYGPDVPCNYGLFGPKVTSTKSKVFGPKVTSAKSV